MAHPRQPGANASNLGKAIAGRYEDGHSAERIAAAHREERLTREGEKKKYTLKNGAQAEGSSGLFTLRELQGLQTKSPRLFQALLAIAQGRPQDATPESVAELRRALFLRANHQIIPETRDVLLSAYQETAEGPVLVNPYRFENAAQAREVEQLYNEALDWVIREVRRKDDKGQFPGPD